VHAFDEVVRRFAGVFTICPSPYGAAVLCEATEDALEITAQALRSLGPAVTVGLDTGFLVRVRSTDGDSFVGEPLNRAARLAFLPNLRGRAAASDDFVKAAIGAKERFGSTFFGPSVQGKVKKTELTYRLIESSEYIQASPREFELSD